MGSCEIWIHENFDKSILEHLNRPKYSEKERVFVRCVIDSSGKLTPPGIAKGIDSLFDKECIRVVEKMPISWIPATVNGEYVNCWMTIPISLWLNQAVQKQSERKRKVK